MIAVPPYAPSVPDWMRQVSTALKSALIANNPNTNQIFSQNNASIFKFGDKVLIGGATLSDSAFPNVEQDWLSAFQVAAGLSSGAPLSSHLIALTNDNAGSAVGIVGGARSLNFSSAFTSAIANSAYVVNDNATLATNAWAFYAEAHRTTAAAGSIYGAEYDVRTLTASIDPNPNQQGDVIGLQLAVGAELSATGQFDGSAGIQFAANPKKWKVGLNFMSDSLVVTSGVSYAAKMAPGQRLSWIDGSNVEQMYADGQVLKLRAYAVASLPTASAALNGARAQATDLSGATFTYGAAAVGGGTRKGPVFCDGSGWKEG